MDSQTNSILTALYSKANPKNVEGMARYGIKSTNNVLGLTSNDLFSLAKNIGTNQALALELWQSGIYEARILAALIADPKQLKKSTMNSWAKDFDNWALRQIGKRNLKLNAAAMKTAKEIQKLNSSSAKWIAADALRELQNMKVQKRIRIGNEKRTRK